jgi:predicted RNase H-like HicB family nuclease
MKYLITLEPLETGFGVEVPDLAVATFGETVEAAMRAASLAIRINLDAYRELGMPVPPRAPVASHLENPDNQGLLFAYVDVAVPNDKVAA